MIIVRYADDIVVGFQHKADAERFWSEMARRLAKFALSLHPDKTRLIEFGRSAAADRARRGLGKPETFNFLGFTHICARSKAGRFQLRRRTRRDRMRVKLREIRDALWQHRHAPLSEQGSWLRQWGSRGVIRPLPEIQAFIAGEHERQVGVERLAKRRRVKALELLEGALDAARKGSD